MAYQRFDGTMSFLPSRFEAQAMLSEMQKKKDEEMKLLRLKQAEEQKQHTEALRSERNRILTELKAMTATGEATMSKLFSQTSIPPRPPFPPPDPPDYKTNLTSKTSTSKKIPLRYSIEEIYERMESGFCIFCEDLDTPGHHNLKHKGSKLCLVESVGDKSPDDEKPDEVTVEEISNKSLNMIREKESNLENESRPEVSVSQFQVPFSSLEPSRRCHKTHNHYESLDVVDKDMCDEPVCGKDGDYIPTVSAKFREKYEDPQFELVCLKQSHDPVENHLDNFGFALTRSSLQHTPTDQYRASFNPYQNCNDECHYKREFGNYTEHETEFDRECEEIEDDELKDKQPEEDVEILVMSENEKSLECVDDESSVNEKLIEVIAEETAFEPMDWSGCNVYKERNLNSFLLQEFQILLFHVKESSDTIAPCRNLDTRVLSSHFFAGGITQLSKMVCAFLLPFLTMNIDSRTICLNSRSIFVDGDVVALRRTVEDRFVPRMEGLYLESIKQNLEFAIDRGWVEFWINTHDFTLTNYGLRLSPSEYTKNIFILVYHLSKHSSSYLFLNTSTGCIGALLMVYDAKRLIQLDDPPIFNDLLCVMNQIRVRLKMVLLVEFLWLILFTSKMFKSSNVHQNKNQVDQKLSSYWKFLLRLLHPLHINRWRSFYLLVIKSHFKGKEESVSFNVAVTSCSSYVKVLELIKDKASRKRKLCKNWWFKYKFSTWLSEAFHFWKYKKQLNQGQICLNGLCNELVYGIKKKKLMNVEGDIMKDKKLDHNLIALNLQICCCIGGLSASGFEMETWTVKKSLEWLNKLTIAISLAQMFLDHVCKLQGTPQDMLSDRDPTFLIELFRVLRADLSSDTTYEFVFVQPHPVHFPFRLEETLFAVVMDINFQKKEELIPMSKVHLSQGQNKAATKALVQWKEHPPDQATWEFYQDLVAKYPDFQP